MQRTFQISFLALFIMLIAGLLITAAATPEPEGEPLAQGEVVETEDALAQLEIGEEIYGRYCSTCHGIEGGGVIGPALAGNLNLVHDQYVITRILLGGGGMPSFYPRLTEVQVALVASYIRTAWENDYGLVDAEQVARQWWDGADSAEALYTRICARCHGDDGGGFIGPPLVSNPDLQSAAYVVGKILQGGGGMPAFDRLLSEEQIAVLAGYIRTAWGNTFGPVEVELVEQLDTPPQADDQPREPPSPGVSGLAITAGAPIYEVYCQVCHGGRGDGGVAPALAGNPDLEATSYVLSRIVMGSGGMPPFNEELSSAEIAAVATTIRTSWGNAFGAVSLAEAQSYHGGASGLVPQGEQ